MSETINCIRCDEEPAVGTTADGDPLCRSCADYLGVRLPGELNQITADDTPETDDEPSEDEGGGDS